MSKKTTVSEQKAKLTGTKHKAYADSQEIKRAHDGYEAETEGKKADLAARRATHPEEFEGEQFTPRPGTESAERQAEIKRRMSEPNPFADDLAKARRAYQAAEMAERGFSARHLPDLIDEVNAELAGDDDELREAWLKVAEITGRKLAKYDEILGLVTATDGVNGQSIEFDPTTLAWHKFAKDAAERRLRPPTLTAEAHRRLDLVVKEAEGHE